MTDPLWWFIPLACLTSLVFCVGVLLVQLAYRKERE